LFDILNSRSAIAKGYKQPLHLNGISVITPFLKDTRQYLLGLKNNEGIPLYKTKR